MDTNYLDVDGATLYAALIKSFVTNKKFVGTLEEYKTACGNNEIPENTIVIITDGETSTL